MLLIFVNMCRTRVSVRDEFWIATGFRPTPVSGWDEFWVGTGFGLVGFLFRFKSVSIFSVFFLFRFGFGFLFPFGRFIRFRFGFVLIFSFVLISFFVLFRIGFDLLSFLFHFSSFFFFRLALVGFDFLFRFDPFFWFRFRLLSFLSIFLFHFGSVLIFSVNFADGSSRRFHHITEMLMLINFAYTLLVLNYSCVGFMASVIFNAYLYIFLITLLKNLIFLIPGWALCHRY
ncbi:hypothetical protein Hanom_Chr13g01215661 [Helianthus anomalus]